MFMSIPKLKNTAEYVVKKFVLNLALLSLRSRGISNSLLLQISKASEPGRIHTTDPKAPVININCLGKEKSKQCCVCCCPSSCTSGSFRSEWYHRRAVVSMELLSRKGIFWYRPVLQEGQERCCRWDAGAEHAYYGPLSDFL